MAARAPGRSFPRGQAGRGGVTSCLYPIESLAFGRKRAHAGALRWTSPGLPPTFLLSLSNVGPVVYSGDQWRPPPEEPIPRLDLHFLPPFQFQIVLQTHSLNVPDACRNAPLPQPRLHSSSTLALNFASSNFNSHLFIILYIGCRLFTSFIFTLSCYQHYSFPPLVAHPVASGILAAQQLDSYA